MHNIVPNTSNNATYKSFKGDDFSKVSETWRQDPEDFITILCRKDKV